MKSVVATITNKSAGFRGFHAVSGEVLLPPGESWSGEISEAELKSALAREEDFESGEPLDHDGDGKKGGSNVDNPPSLSGKNKAELLEIAAAEGVDATEEMTNAAIVELIELNRAG